MELALVSVVILSDLEISNDGLSRVVYTKNEDVPDVGQGWDCTMVEMSREGFAVRSWC
jgi:hypothetical protein